MRYEDAKDGDVIHGWELTGMGWQGEFAPGCPVLMTGLQRYGAWHECQLRWMTSGAVANQVVQGDMHTEDAMKEVAKVLSSGVATAAPPTIYHRRKDSYGAAYLAKLAVVEQRRGGEGVVLIVEDRDD